MLGLGLSRRGRMPSWEMVASLLLIAFLAFNYWDVSRKQRGLLDELAEAQTQARRVDSARSRLDKRNAELIGQVEVQRKQLEESKAQVDRCTQEKDKLLSASSAKMTEIHKLNEQLVERSQKLAVQEKLLFETQKNFTILEKKLETQRSLYRDQIKKLRAELSTNRAKLEEGAAKQNKNLDVTAMNKGEVLDQLDIPDRKGVLKDTGVIGVEDKETRKEEDVNFALIKPAITQKKSDVAVVALQQKAVPDFPIKAVEGLPHKALLTVALAPGQKKIQQWPGHKPVQGKAVEHAGQIAGEVTPLTHLTL